MGGRRRHGRALWTFALTALVMAGGASVYRDDRPGRITRPGFTVYAVDDGGEQSTIAHFDGQGWRSACGDSAAPLDEAPSSRRGATAPVAQITGLVGTPGAPLLRVRDLTGDTVGWEPTADAVEARAVAEAGLTGPRTTAPRVYSADSAGTGVSYVETVVRVPPPAFRGVVATAWVIVHDERPPQLVDFRMTRFRTYDEYLALPRQVPLGIVDDIDERVWVMGVRTGLNEDVRLVSVNASEAQERLRVGRRGC